MTVTFIAHSAYLVEWDKFYTLFDYTYEPDYTGALPGIKPRKALARLCEPQPRGPLRRQGVHTFGKVPRHALFRFAAIRASPSASGNG